jgi:hypothetical protein
MHLCAIFCQLVYIHLIHSTIHAPLCEFSFNLSKFISYTVTEIHAFLCEFSVNLSKFLSYTVLYMHSCANFLSIRLSMPHTQYYPCTLVRIFFQLVHSTIHALKVYLKQSTIHALLCEFSFNLSKFPSYTVLSMHS